MSTRIWVDAPAEPGPIAVEVYAAGSPPPRAFACPCCGGATVAASKDGEPLRSCVPCGIAWRDGWWNDDGSDASPRPKWDNNVICWQKGQHGPKCEAQPKDKAAQCGQGAPSTAQAAYDPPPGAPAPPPHTGDSSAAPLCFFCELAPVAKGSILCVSCGLIERWHGRGETPLCGEGPIAPMPALARKDAEARRVDHIGARHPCRHCGAVAACMCPREKAGW